MPFELFCAFALSLTPIVVSTWPLLTAAVTAAAATAGFHVVKPQKKEVRQNVRWCELDVKNVDVVTDSLRLDDSITVERDGARVIFSRDGRGKMKVSVEGNRPRSELEKIGQELAGLVVQQYIHRRLCEEFERKGFVLLEEEREKDQTIRLHLRAYRD